jgi:hypothetical protein
VGVAVRDADLAPPEHPSFLEEAGLLHEINRRVLHPVGYHMRVVRDNGGVPPVAVITVQHIESLVGGLMDSDNFLRGAAKFASFLAERGAAVIKQRIREYNFVEQESPFVEDEGPAPGPQVK